MSTRLQPGNAAPDFTLPAASGDHITLSDFTGKRVIVYFYPAAMTPGCTTQAIDFTAHLDEFEEAGLQSTGDLPRSRRQAAKVRRQGIVDPDSALR